MEKFSLTVTSLLDMQATSTSKSSSKEKAHARQLRQAEKTARYKAALLDGFDWKNCRAYCLLCKKYKTGNCKKLTRNMILPIAQLVSFKDNIPLTREAQRDKLMLIRWCEDNFEHLQRNLHKMSLYFSDGEIIP